MRGYCSKHLSAPTNIRPTRLYPMATAQTFPNATAYPFLSKPPPPQKKRPTQPLPPPPPPAPTQSKFFSSIAVWATQVQPGSPAPCSPRRRTASPSATASFLHIATPSIKDFDLTTLGYTSVFVHLPKTPITPFLRKQPMAHVNPDIFPIPPSPKRPRAAPHTLKRFRSLSILRPRTRSTPPSPTKSLTSHSKSKKATTAAAIAKRKKSIYSRKSSKPKYSTSAPVPLANELALMQLMDGGNTETNIKRLMEEQAITGRDGVLVVGDVYRDEKGGIWRDRDEELEYAHLLGGDVGEEGIQWVTFEDVVMAELEEEDPSLALASLAGLGRRDSNASAKTVDSDLDPTNVVKPADEDAGMVHVNVPGLVHAKPPSTVAPAILSIPTRPNQPHLRKSPQFLLDLVAFAPSSLSPSSPRHPCTPISERTSPIRSSFGLGPSTPRLRGKARRRPTPLQLGPRDENVYLIWDGEGDVVDQARRDFIDGSFKPAPLPFGLAPPSAMPFGSSSLSRSRSFSGKMGLMKKTSRIGFGIFGRRDS